MNRKILGLLASLALAAGCELAKKTTYEGPIEQCRPTVPASACTENAECCSYGCVQGQCVAGNHLGTVCKNTNDCGVLDILTGQMTCKSGACVATTATVCRDDADICDVPSDCCSNHCTGTGGSCVPNNAPVILLGAAVQEVPRNQDWPLVNTSYDPDTADWLVYGWRIVSAYAASGTPSGTLVTNNAKNSVFRPGSVIATYLLEVDVRDNWGLLRTGQVTLQVVNKPPTITPAPPLTTSRNVPLGVNMSVSDANGDPNITCTWEVRRPNGNLYTPPLAAPPAFAGLPGATLTAPFPTGLLPDDEGTWTVALTCSDGQDLSSPGITSVTVVNDPPVVATIEGVAVIPGVPATRTYNLAFNASDTTAKTITATATDKNGDVPVTDWTWEVVSAPQNVILTGANGDTVGFTPTAPGVYKLRVTACDPPATVDPATRPKGCGYAEVDAKVYPYIRPLTGGPGSVADAEWRKIAGNERLVAVGKDSSSANQLWLVNPSAAPGSDTAVALGSIPVAVSLSGDGLTALVGEQTGHWQTVSVGATPTASSLWTSPMTITDVVNTSTSRGYALGTGGTSAVYDLNLSTGASAPMACRNCTLAGNRAVGSGSLLWVLNDAGNTISRYSEIGNDLNRDFQAMAPSVASDVWRSSDANYLYMNGTGGIVFTANLASTTASLPAGTTHVDSSGTGASLVGLAATSGTVTPFGSSFAPGAPIALPHWGLAGADRAVSARFVFVSADGLKAHVVVEAIGTIDWGVYTCTLPCPLF